ncbi:MAG: ABC transporter permease [Chloroflexi bacterium]|nr:ABC transporter permease [Chloroflexota bacterium]
MLKFVFRRVLLMIPTVFVISVISFLVMEAPPGDYMDSYVTNLINTQQYVDPAEVEALRLRYGLDDPLYVRYYRWISGVLRGDLGRSLAWSQPVKKLIAERLPWTLAISISALILTYLIAIPIGTYVATHQYSPGDYLATLVGFLGLSIPTFLIALIVVWLYFLATRQVAVGLFSQEFETAPWSFAKVVDLLKHLWVPAFITGTAGTAGTIRTVRANLLDELSKPYVEVARAKGLNERKLLYKYPFRMAMNPVASTIGWALAGLVNGELMTSLVLGLPTMAPLLVGALQAQDMMLAASIVLLLSTLTVIGTLVSDILLVWIDPRIRTTMVSE